MENEIGKTVAITKGPNDEYDGYDGECQWRRPAT